MSIPDLPVTILNDDELKSLASAAYDSLDPLMNGIDSLLISQIKRVLAHSLDEWDHLSVHSLSDQERADLLHDADIVRDRAFLRFRHAVLMAQLSDDYTRMSTAERLLAVIRKHGFSLHTSSYPHETSALHALFNDLESDFAKVDMEVLHLSSTLEKLKKAQSDFEAISDQVLPEQSESTARKRASIRAELRESLLLLRDALAYLSKYAADGEYAVDAVDVDPDPHKELKEQITVVITKAVYDARQRRSKEPSVTPY